MYGGSHLPGHCAGQDTGLDGGSVMEVMTYSIVLSSLVVYMLCRLLVHMVLD